ncbi:sigma-70 family RNA polymerase sigma factor [Pediococcus pentosaceus]|uniref:sigma-70 family RNA polymerase sigma factor n=1 Tax=Pediococcus pentosaceus TaxID=1255 RepID=UPI0021A73BD3|nr:sigma-70 family RNA polymerase sigma factor [Pediococcus pentosaceus]MCT3024675.1 sigma-70 family RNA polymerase sigma factor [Pediococcus pentosaceus]
MENNERTIKLGLENLLEDGHEKIVYGALKKLHINTRSVEFDDFLQEARLVYAKAYVRFPQDLQENDRQFHGYAYQAVYWRVLDIIRYRQKEKDVQAVELEDDEKQEARWGHKPSWVERIMSDQLFQEVYKLCTPAEKRFLKACYVEQLSGAEIARKEKVSRQSIYKWRKAVGKKALYVIGKGEDMDYTKALKK